MESKSTTPATSSVTAPVTTSSSAPATAAASSAAPSSAPPPVTKRRKRATGDGTGDTTTSTKSNKKNAPKSILLDIRASMIYKLSADSIPITEAEKKQKRLNPKNISHILGYHHEMPASAFTIKNPVTLLPAQPAMIAHTRHVKTKHHQMFMKYQVAKEQVAAMDKDTHDKFLASGGTIGKLAKSLVLSAKQCEKFLKSPLVYRLMDANHFIFPVLKSSLDALTEYSARIPTTTGVREVGFADVEWEFYNPTNTTYAFKPILPVLGDEDDKDDELVYEEEDDIVVSRQSIPPASSSSSSAAAAAAAPSIVSVSPSVSVPMVS